MRLEHHLVGGYVRYISPHIIIIIINALHPIQTWAQFHRAAYQRILLSKYFP